MGRQPAKEQTAVYRGVSSMAAWWRTEQHFSQGGGPSHRFSSPAFASMTAFIIALPTATLVRSCLGDIRRRTRQADRAGR